MTFTPTGNPLLRDRTREISVPKTIRERRCDFCDQWFRLTRPARRYCSKKHQKADGARRRRARNTP